MSASRTTRASGSSKWWWTIGLNSYLNSLLNFCFFLLLFRERVSLKRREEAWEKLEEAAKRNPTFYELAESLNVPSSSSSSSTFDRFGASSSFAMIDEDGNGAGGEDEDLLEELAAYEAAKQCDTQVNGEKERVGSLSESLMSCFCLQAATGDKQQRDNAWRRKSKLSIDLVSSTTGPGGGGSSYAAAAAAASSANLDGTSSISPTSSTSINSTVVRSQNSTDIAAAAAASGEPADDKGSVGDR